MLEPLQYPFFQRALTAALLASIACGIVGTYVVVKRITAISGGLSHAAFGGVGLAYLLGFEPMIGAAGFALGSGIGIGVAYRRLGSHLDTLIAIVWASGMALGVLFVSSAPGYAPDLMSYLFGSLLFVPAKYVWIVAALDLAILLAVGLLFKEFQAVAFDEEFAQVTGLPVQTIVLAMLGLVSLAVVALIRVVGIILVIALLTIPAATAAQWCTNLRRMMLVSTLIGASCSTLGLFLSYWLADSLGVSAPTGPLIILLALAVYLVSSLLRGGHGPAPQMAP